MWTPRSRVSTNLTQAMGWFTWGGGTYRKGKDRHCLPVAGPLECAQFLGTISEARANQCHWGVDG